MRTTRPSTVNLVALAASVFVGTGTVAKADTMPCPFVAANAARAVADIIVIDTTVIVVDVVHSQGSELKTLLQREIAKAVALGRTPFVEIGATWCEPCHALRDALGDPRMIKAFAGTYIIRLDLDEWKEQLPQLKLAAQFVPIFFAIDKTGNGTGKELIPRFKFGPGEDLTKQAAPQLTKFFQSNLWKS